MPGNPFRNSNGLTTNTAMTPTPAAKRPEMLEAPSTRPRSPIPRSPVPRVTPKKVSLSDGRTNFRLQTHLFSKMAGENKELLILEKQYRTLQKQHTLTDEQLTTCRADLRKVRGMLEAQDKALEDTARRLEEIQCDKRELQEERDTLKDQVKRVETRLGVLLHQQGGGAVEWENRMVDSMRELREAKERLEGQVAQQDALLRKQSSSLRLLEEAVKAKEDALGLVAGGGREHAKLNRASVLKAVLGLREKARILEEGLRASERAVAKEKEERTRLQQQLQAREETLTATQERAVLAGEEVGRRREELEAALGELEAKREEWRAERSIMLQCLQEEQQQREALEHQLERAEEGAERLQGEAEALASDREALQEQHDQLQHELHALQSEVDDDAGLLQARVAELEAETLALRDAHAHAALQLDAANHALGVAQGKGREQVEEIGGLNEQLDALSEANLRLQDALQGVEQEKSMLQARLRGDAQGGGGGDLEREEALRKEVRALEQEVRAAREETGRVERRALAAEEHARQAAAAQAHLQAEAQHLRDHIDTLSRSKKVLQKMHLEQLASVTAQLKHAKQAVREAEAEKADLRRRLHTPLSSSKDLSPPEAGGERGGEGSARRGRRLSVENVLLHALASGEEDGRSPLREAYLREAGANLLPSPDQGVLRSPEAQGQSSPEEAAAWDIGPSPSPNQEVALSLEEIASQEIEHLLLAKQGSGR